MTLVFLDTNIPLYAAGGEHPLKEPCRLILLLAAEHPASFVTDVEVFQEIMHRAMSLRRWAQGRQVMAAFADLMEGRVEPVHYRDVQLAAELADTLPDVQSRDLLHAAVIKRLGARRIVSADTGFDRIPGLERLEPSRFNEWRRIIET
ncbi:MAG: type II toxin-antitoxin system VapC family toxin [SAR202 cluster bacterium]|nr:type II toxin-antitoxin system VapC family toxin [SAR202 cluster bacterium]